MMLHFYNLDGRCYILTFNFHSTFWNTYSCSLLRLFIIYIKFIFINKEYWKLGFFLFEHFQIDYFYMSLSFGNPFNLQAKGCKIRLTVHCFADTVSDFYPNDSHFSVSTWNIGAKASCASFFSSALFILKKMRKKIFRPEKLTHNF